MQVSCTLPAKVSSYTKDQTTVLRLSEAAKMTTNQPGQSKIHQLWMTSLTSIDSYQISCSFSWEISNGWEVRERKRIEIRRSKVSKCNLICPKSTKINLRWLKRQPSCFRSPWRHPFLFNWKDLQVINLKLSKLPSMLLGLKSMIQTRATKIISGRVPRTSCQANWIVRLSVVTDSNQASKSWRNLETEEEHRRILHRWSLTLKPMKVRLNSQSLWKPL